MTDSIKNILRYSDKDLDFLVETTSPNVRDKERLKQVLRNDEDFRTRYVADDKVFAKLMDDDEILLKISPALFFEILIRRAAIDLEGVGYTLERSSSVRVPVFDTQEVLELLSRDSLILYLSEMLSSFTRIESYSLSFRIRKGVWKKFRFNDLDIQSLMAFCDVVEPEFRLGFYKRIADICLFMLGIYSEFTERDYRYPFSGHVRPHHPGKTRISPEEYEKEGQRFYGLAAEHDTARAGGLSEVFQTLCDHFQKAQKPLNFIAEHYLRYRREMVFV